MMVAKKLTEEDCKTIIKLIDEGHQIKDIAKKYNVHRSTIENRCKTKYKSNKIPVEIKNRIIKAIKDGHTKAEAAQLYGLNIGTVYNLTRELGINGHKSQGNHIIRKTGISLLNRLMTDGYLISDFHVPVVRNLQDKFPLIRSARYKDKTFFYLPDREEETIEAFFREKPDRVISFRSIEEMAFLLGVKISKSDQRRLLERYKKKHRSYWESRRLIQRSLDDWLDESKTEDAVFRLMPKTGEW